MDTDPGGERRNTPRSRDIRFPGVRRLNSPSNWQDATAACGLYIPKPREGDIGVTPEHFPLNPPNKPFKDPVDLGVIGGRVEMSTSEVQRILEHSKREFGDLGDGVDLDLTKHLPEIFRVGENPENFWVVMLESKSGPIGSQVVLSYHVSGVNGPTIEPIPLKGSWSTDHLFLYREKLA